jgi:hypothetical protein
MRNDSVTGLLFLESQALRRLADIMVPPDEAFDVPGAGDAMIFADIERSLGRDLDGVRAALCRLSMLAAGAFAALDNAEAEALATTFLAGDGAAATILGRVILQCYYRDDRVIRSLGLEPRPPFPKGHTLEQGDWSLLDPVRGRAKMWRDAP